MTSRYLSWRWVLLLVVTRLLPHPANATPLLALCCFLPSQQSHWRALTSMMLAMLISDIGLSLEYHFSILGSWSLFTYSGLALSIWLSNYFGCRWLSLYASILLYWTWTNFGVFLISGLYPHTSLGLSACYLSALPFLRDSFLANSLYFALLLLMYPQGYFRQPRWLHQPIRQLRLT